MGVGDRVEASSHAVRKRFCSEGPLPAIMDRRQIPPDLPRTFPRRNVVIIDIRMDLDESVLLVFTLMGEFGDPIVLICRLVHLAVVPAEPEPEP